MASDRRRGVRKKNEIKQTGKRGIRLQNNPIHTYIEFMYEMRVCEMHNIILIGLFFVVVSVANGNKYGHA